MNLPTVIFCVEAGSQQIIQNSINTRIIKSSKFMRHNLNITKAQRDYPASNLAFSIGKRDRKRICRSAYKIRGGSTFTLF